VIVFGDLGNRNAQQTNAEVRHVCVILSFLYLLLRGYGAVVIVFGDLGDLLLKRGGLCCHDKFLKRGGYICYWGLRDLLFKQGGYDKPLKREGYDCYLRLAPQTVRGSITVHIQRGSITVHPEIH